MPLNTPPITYLLIAYAVFQVYENENRQWYELVKGKIGATRYNYPFKEVRTSHVSLNGLLEIKYFQGRVFPRDQIYYSKYNQIFIKLSSFCNNITT